MIVQSLSGVSGPSSSTTSRPEIGLGLAAGVYRTYSEIWRQQPYVRTAVDFLWRNVSQLPIHVFRRLPDDNRERLRDHGFARWLQRPNSYESRVTFMGALVRDVAMYGRAIRLKVRPKRGPELEAVRVPLECVELEGGWFPEVYHIQFADGRRSFPPSEVIDLRFDDPDDPLGAVSPIESLRRILAEDYAMGRYRESFWRNNARPAGFIEQHENVRPMTPEQQAEWLEQFTRLYGGPDKAGKVPVLRPGMRWVDAGRSVQDTEVATARRLTREEVAVAYHIPPPMVGLLEDATLSNVKNLHRLLYQDVLGWWLAWLRAELERQVLWEFLDTDGVYSEFVTAAKLAGSFEDEASALEKLAGRPVMTANEARARLNLPKLAQGDADKVWLDPGTPGAGGPRREGEGD